MFFKNILKKRFYKKSFFYKLKKNRIVFGSFRIVSDNFGGFSDKSIFDFQISIGQGWGTAVADRRSDPSGPTAVPRPAPALAN